MDHDEMFARFVAMHAGELIICRGAYTPVEWIKVHPPGEHPESPIDNAMHAVQVHTARGDRWAGKGLG
jgi:hypothetical protein